MERAESARQGESLPPPILGGKLHWVLVESKEFSVGLRMVWPERGLHACMEPMPRQRGSRVLFREAARVVWILELVWCGLRAGGLFGEFEFVSVSIVSS